MDNVSHNERKIYLGMDVSQKNIELFAVCGSNGSSLPAIKTSSVALKNLFENFTVKKQQICAVLETGTHANWISTCLEDMGIEVIVAHARDLAYIYNSDKKSDRIDAEKLARLAQADRKLLHPVKLKSRKQQEDLLAIKTRDLLVAERVKLINSLRGFIRSFGYDDSSYSPETIQQINEILPKTIQKSLKGLFITLSQINVQIKYYDKLLEKKSKEYPETEVLQQIKGVGPLTALAFALIIGNPHRFTKREISSYTGLAPKRDQSGDVDKQLGISKAGNKLLRRLLVQCSQYIMGPFGEDCNLRRFGERIAARGGSIAKKKAKIAVARKLAITMMALWRNPEIKYQPNFKTRKKVA